MPGNVQQVSNESEGLIAYLAQQRYGLRLTAYGLSDEQARATPTVSTLSVGGVIKHVSAVERYWMSLVEQIDRSAEQIDSTTEQTEDDYENGFRLGPDETLQGVLDCYVQSAKATEGIVSSIGDMGHPVPVPKGVPWFPKDVDAWSLRWVLLHLIEETARHAGHADIVREAVDGGTGFALMAAAEGWPESAWLKPWQPAQ